ncbi:conserved hypothetical protein [Alteracholeplasma palmae J233]|uniref:Uncharacterized protein n=2 Tax=Acholeplasma palmae TaxID=38986 RepID=U4KL27_ALTPJ|nr:conserved hypothetical protein [Alteracholeplasma palmae J233]
MRLDFGIKNSRIWHLCSLELEKNSSATLDNWTRYNGGIKEIFYINDKIKFLEIDHFNHTFTFYKSNIRKQNKEDFRRYYKDYFEYTEIEEVSI